jgi:hypothetical protein
MSARSSATKPEVREVENEWLGIIESLDELMARRVAQTTNKVLKPTLGKGIFAALNSAYAATLRYYTSLLHGGQHNPKAEREISRLWQKTGMGIRRCDPDLAIRLKGTNAFWASDVTWEAKTIQEAWVRLNAIRVNVNRLSPELNADSRWSRFSSS